MPTKSTAKRPPIGINTEIPLPIQRDLQRVANYAFAAQDKAEAAQATANAASTINAKDLEQIRSELQSGGSTPLNLTGLPTLGKATAGSGLVQTTVNGQTTIALPTLGPGAGTYTVGAKLTALGNNGQITIDAFGRITGITQAT